MAKTFAIALAVVLAAPLAACDRNGGASKAGTQQSDGGASATSASPTKPTGTPMQTGEVPAGTSAGDGSKTGVRNTPPPK